MNPARAWLLAARPATLWAGVVPVVVGAGLALGDASGRCVGIQVCHEVRLDAFLVTMIGALAIQIAANFANDASDAKRGVDNDERIGPIRVVAEGILTSHQVWTGVWVMFSIAAVCGIYLAAISSPVIIVLGVVSVLATLGYVGGPKPYGYMGFGEVFVFLFFGVVATVASRYVHDSSAPLDAWLLSIPVGFLATAILVVNNIRDIETDRASGKRTLAVILGREATAHLFDGLVSGAFILIGVFAAVGWTPGWTALAVLAAPLAAPISRLVRTATEGPPLIRALKGTARLHLLAGVLLAIGAGVA